MTRTEKFMDWFVNWRFCVPVETTIIVWSFIGYWICVSGWEFMAEVKLAMALAPIVGFTVYGIIKRSIRSYRNRQRQKEIMLNVKVRRILDQYVA